MAWQSPALNCELKLDEISDFIRQHDAAFSGRLSGFHNYSRIVSLAHFVALTEKLGLTNQAHTGVVSGYANEPELHFLKSEKTTILNFDTDRSFDLDKSWAGSEPLNFSATLCNQVLEHVFNPHVAFKNLIHHTRPNGHIYVTIPTINCIHGEPYFYSSGFHPRFLERIGLENGLEVLNIGYWGSFKYMLNAVSGVWLTDRQLGIGAAAGIVQIPNVDGRVKQDQYITDCWGLFRKR